MNCIVMREALPVVDGILGSSEVACHTGVADVVDVAGAADVAHAGDAVDVVDAVHWGKGVHLVDSEDPWDR